MAILQTRIFVCNTAGHDWAETLAGSLVRPLTAEYHDHLEWFWFSRYVCIIGMQGEDTGDCDLNAIPEEFKQPFLGMNEPGHRSLRFRFEIADGQRNAFEQKLRELLAQHNYVISDIRPYAEAMDTGGQRFLAPENRSPARAQTRARLVTYVYYTASQLLLDMLIGPDPNGRYRVEKNDLIQQNPNGSSFESVHHVFCNITSVPTSILFAQRNGQQELQGTYWGKPTASRQFQANGENYIEVYVRY